MEANLEFSDFCRSIQEGLEQKKELKKYQFTIENGAILIARIRNGQTSSAEMKLDDCRNDIERAVHESEYQRLKEDERRVGKLYEKTCYGRAVDILADRLAEKLFDNILKGKYKQEIQEMAERIR